MGTHPIFESDFDCLTDYSNDMSRPLYSFVTDKEQESGGSDGGYAVSNNSSGRNSIRSNGSPIENSVVDFSPKPDLYNTMDLIEGDVDENVFSAFLTQTDKQFESIRRLNAPDAQSWNKNGNKIHKKRTRRKSATETRVCLVCGDKATGYHFNAMTCEGCKGFFRRAIKGSKKFACAYENNCQIEKRSRRHCSACRFNKCVEVGMKKECIMSDEQIHRKV